MTGPLKLGTLGQISRSVKDIKQAETWYREVLGLTHLYTWRSCPRLDKSVRVIPGRFTVRRQLLARPLAWCRYRL
jgi:hypothetical protein